MAGNKANVLESLIKSGKEFSYREGGGGSPSIGEQRNSLGGLLDSQLSDPLAQIIQRLGLVNNARDYSPGRSLTGRDALSQESNMLYDLLQKQMGLNSNENGIPKGQLNQTQSKTGSSVSGGNIAKNIPQNNYQPRTGGGFQGPEQKEEDPYKKVRDEALKRALDYLQKIGLNRAIG